MDSEDYPGKIESEKHVSDVDSDSVNKAVERASKDRIFIFNAVEQLNGLKFPVYKAQIMDFLKKSSANDELLSLFETLNGTIVYRDQYHVKKALEQNNSKAKQDNQITDETSTNLEAVKINPAHKRKDYPEVPATALKEYVCELCGKTFQTPDDLTHHQQFEGKSR